MWQQWPVYAGEVAADRDGHVGCRVGGDLRGREARPVRRGVFRNDLRAERGSAL